MAAQWTRTVGLRSMIQTIYMAQLKPQKLCTLSTVAIWRRGATRRFLLPSAGDTSIGFTQCKINSQKILDPLGIGEHGLLSSCV